MESRGNKQLTMDGEDIGVNQFGSTLQFGGGYPLNGYEKVKLNFDITPLKLQIINFSKILVSSCIEKFHIKRIKHRGKKF